MDGNWHVSLTLKGMGQIKEYVYYVQRYVTPQEARRFTGEIATRTWDNWADAQKAADAANDGRIDFNIRGTYL